MSPATRPDGGVDRLRLLAAGVAERLGGNPAVRVLRATLETYDRAGGGLVAGGLAYASLLAILPGILLLLSVLGIVIGDPGLRERVVELVGGALPPLEEVVRLAFEQVSQGAVPGGIVAVLALLWGSSRFYAAIDRAISRVFHGERPRSEVERTLRGVLLTVVVVAMPLVALLLGALAGWLLDLGPGVVDVTGMARVLVQVLPPAGSFVLFVAGTLLVYRLVPGTPPPARAYGLPALLVGLALAAFAQVFTWAGPRLAGVSSVYGTLVTAFALLAWLSISFNLVLLGAAWTRVRALGMGHAGTRSRGD